MPPCDHPHHQYLVVVLGVLVFYPLLLSAKPQTSTQVAVGKVRLVGGESVHSGRVEALVGGVWGYVCATMFDDLDAKVVCREVGYSGDAVGYRDSRYGSAIGPQHLSHLDCSGDEPGLQNCPSNTTATCTDGHASVTCYISVGRVDEALARILPQPCGEPIDASQRFVTSLAKVRDGSDVNRFQTPWIATLYRGSKADSHFCGAAVISDEYLLTVAHCLDDKWVPDLRIRVGEHNRDIDDSKHQDFEIEEVIIHNHYDEVFRADNDIALIKIKKVSGTGITFNERVQPICLPKTGTRYQGRTNCTITGWGKEHYLLGATGERFSGNIDILPMSVCNNRYKSTHHTSSMVCAAPSSGKLNNPCGGDSGGPLTCQVEADSRSTLMGLVSIGARCDFTTKFPDKYTRVEKYLRWILENVENRQNINVRNSKDFLLGRTMLS